MVRLDTVPERPLVSVLMPTFNHERYIEEAIESVLSQDYQQIELLVGDDASMDATPRLVRKYAGKYPARIRAFIAEQNEGVSKNLNNLLEHSRGRLLAFTSGDDVSLPSRISRQVDALEEVPLAVLCGSATQLVDAEGNRLRVSDISSADPAEREADPIAYSIRIAAYNATSFLVRREVLPKWGFEAAVDGASDWLFWLEVLLKGPAVLLPDILACYRRHPDNFYKRDLHRMHADNLTLLNVVHDRYPDLSRCADRHRREYFVTSISRYYSDLVSEVEGGEERLLASVVKNSGFRPLVRALTRGLRSRLAAIVRGLLARGTPPE